MDIIFISDLRVDAIIGIYDRERTQAQRLRIDLELASDIGPAARSEDIADALNYHTLSEAVRAFVEQSDFQLIETLAEAITELIMRDFSVPWVRLCLHKPDALSGTTNVGLIIERGDASLMAGLTPRVGIASVTAP